jgi:hypothetical protein
MAGLVGLRPVVIDTRSVTTILRTTQAVARDGNCLVALDSLDPIAAAARFPSARSRQRRGTKDWSLKITQVDDPDLTETVDVMALL